MTSKEFVDMIFQKIFDLPKAQENADASREGLIEFLNANPNLLKIYPSRVTNFLLQSCIQLTKKKTRQEIITNVYLKESIMFAILSCQFDMPLLKKYAKVFVDTLLDTSHYTMKYKKPSKYSRTVIYEPDMPIEFFWIMPLFITPLVVVKMDFDAYIEECSNLTKSVEGFKEGYEYFVLNAASFDKTSFKTFMTEAVQTATKTN